MNPTPLFEMFPFLKDSNRLTSDYSGARVVSASVKQAQSSMEIVLLLSHPAPPFEISIIENLISNEFDIKTVSVNTTYSNVSGNTPGINKTPDTPPSSNNAPNNGTTPNTNNSTTPNTKSTKSTP